MVSISLCWYKVEIEFIWHITLPGNSKHVNAMTFLQSGFGNLQKITLKATIRKIVEYTESDDPRYWKKHWQNKEAYNSEYYKLQTSKKFTYTLNSQGYREKEWRDIDWNNSYVFLGCSHTFGVGVPNDETLPKQVQSATGVYC